MLKSGSARRVAVLLGAVMLGTSGLASAEPEDDRRDFRRRAERPSRDDRRGGEPGHFIERHGDELGLSGEAREQIQTIADESRQRAERLRAETRDAHAEMRELLSQSSPDDAEVLAQSSRVEALKSEQRTNRLEAMLAIRKLLTPEQREQLAAMRANRGAGGRRDFAERDGRGKGGRSGKRRSSCRDDLAKLCPDATTGRERLRCLDAQWEGLSDDCRASFEGRGARGARPQRPEGLDRSGDAGDERSPL